MQNPNQNTSEQAPETRQEEAPEITDLRVHLEAANRHEGDPDKVRFNNFLADFVAGLHGGFHGHLSEYARHREEDKRRQDEAEADYQARIEQNRREAAASQAPAAPEASPSLGGREGTAVAPPNPYASSNPNPPAASDQAAAVNPAPQAEPASVTEQKEA